MNRSASIYANSLYGLAVEENVAAEILCEMETVLGIFEREPAFTQLLSAASISKEERTGMLDACLRGKVQPYLLNFLKLITERGMVRQFGECCAAYRKLYNEDNGILPVSVVSAAPLEDTQKVRLKEKLCKLTGKNVELVCKVEVSCIGGIRIEYDDKMIDGTVEKRLSDVAQLLKNTAF